MPYCMNERLHTSLKFRRMALSEPGYLYVQNRESDAPSLPSLCFL